MKYILTTLFTIIVLYTGIFSQTKGYFQFRGRVYYQGKGIEQASIKIYLNDNLIKTASSKQFGKFDLQFDLNKYFVVKIKKDNKSRTIIVNTTVPRSKRNKTLDHYKVINLVESKSNDLFKLILYYDTKRNKFVIDAASEDLENGKSPYSEATVSQLKHKIEYLTKLLKNNEKLQKEGRKNVPKNQIIVKSHEVVKVIRDIHQDSADIVEIIKNTKQDDCVLKSLDNNIFPDDAYKDNEAIIELRKQLKDIEKTEADSPKKKIKIQEKRLEIIKKAISLSGKDVKEHLQTAVTDYEKNLLEQKLSKISSLQEAMEQIETQLNLAKQTIRTQELKIENEKIVRIFLIFILVIAGIILFVSYIIYKDKKKTNSKLAFQNHELEKLSIVASETTNAVIITDKKGQFIWVNKGYNKLFEYENIQHGKKNIFNMGYDEKVYDKIKLALNKGEATEYITKSKSGSGKVIWVQASVTPILNKINEVSKLVIIYSDITQVKEAQQKIAKQNKQIMDSIHYAKRIQDATLPSERLFKSYFPNSFIYFKPRNVVSGDFYWLSVQDDKFFVAAVDCTGHGVPGAFMSLIGNALLNNIVNERKIYNPAKILGELNKGVLKALNQSNNGQIEKGSDGMDLTICRFDKNKNEIQMALANHTAFIIDNKQEVIEIDGDDISIGDLLFDIKDVKFTTHTVNFKKGDTIYLFSDGYQDQLGGPKYKKLLAKHFKQILQNNNNNDISLISEELNNKLTNWKKNYEQTDDILVMGMRL